MMWKYLLTFNFVCFLNLFVHFVSATNPHVPMVQTKLGKIKGKVVNVQFDGKNHKIRQFLGIPYAKPPVGNLRLKKPEKISSLPKDPFHATQMGASCPQPNAAFFGLETSENCLFLNIYAPMKPSPGQLKPVMLYLHAGGFVIGSKIFYDGSHLSAYGDVIVVAINYRLGPLGFFSTKDTESPGNFGIWDQRMALLWIHDNIAAFGGNISSITLFGHSAGGTSVVYQALYPGNKGFFHKAIAQSGTIAAWGVDRFDSNYKGSVDFAQFTGCGSANTTLMVKCLRDKTSKDIEEATEAYKAADTVDYINKNWLPVFDNDFILSESDQILKELSNESSFSKFTTFSTVDLMIGATKLDGNVFLDSLLFFINESDYGNTAGFYGVTSEQFKKVVVRIMTTIALNEEPCNVSLEATNFEYTDWCDPKNLTPRLKNLVDIGTDSALNAPSVATARAHANSNKSTYVYQFATSSPKPLLLLPPVLLDEESAGHLDDFLYIFGFSSTLLDLFGVNLADVTEEEMRVSKAVMAMWTNFAKTGNPNKPMNLQSIYDNLQWPSFNQSTESYLKITPNMGADSAKTRLRARKVEFWNELLPKLQSLCPSQS